MCIPASSEKPGATSVVLGASSQKNRGSWEMKYVHWSAFCVHTMVPMFSGLDAGAQPRLCASARQVIVSLTSIIEPCQEGG